MHHYILSEPSYLLTMQLQNGISAYSRNKIQGELIENIEDIHIVNILIKPYHCER